MAHPPSRISPARHIHPADHAHEPPASNRPLSRMAVTPGGNKSSALARISRWGPEQAESECCRQSTHPTSIQTDRNLLTERQSGGSRVAGCVDGKAIESCYRLATHGFGPWLAQRIADRCRTDGLYQTSPKAQAESSKTPENIASSRGPAVLPSRRCRMAHTPSGQSRLGTSISRITATSQQDQITRSRGSLPRRPGTSHPLSLKIRSDTTKI